MPVVAQNFKKLTGQGTGEEKEYNLAEMSDLAKDNLLINSMWKSTIFNNQGKSTYDPVNKWTMSIVGWLYFGQMQVFVQDKQIRLYSTSNNTGTTYFKQIVKGLGNRKHLFYIHVVSLSGTAKVTLKTGVDTPLKQGDNFIVTDVENNTLQVQIGLSGKGVDLIIDEMKLEEGEHYTGTPIFFYGVEKLKNERFVRTVNRNVVGYTGGSGIIYLKDESIREMRKAPTVLNRSSLSQLSVTYNGKLSTISLSGANISVDYENGLIKIDSYTGQSNWASYQIAGYLNTDIILDSMDY